jgi:hypothetical protein
MLDQNSGLYYKAMPGIDPEIFSVEFDMNPR